MVKDLNEMKKPKVSVIMAVFNGEKYLTESINSILKQTYFDFEFIIIDDGSTDKSGAIIKNFGDQRIRFFKNRTNRGLPYSLNRGIKISRGIYLVRMDQDDISFPKRIETQVHFMDTNPSIAISGTAVVTTVGKHKEVHRRLSNHEEIKGTLLFHNVLAHSSVIIRKEAIIRAKLLYDPTAKNAEDYEFWTRCCWKVKMTNLTTPLIFYRRHLDQMVSQPEIESIKTTFRNRMLKRFIDNPTKEEVALHSRIAGGITIIDWKEIIAVEDWLKKIFFANNSKQLVEKRAMLTVLEDQWFNVCARSSKLGTGIFQQYWASPITKQAKKRWNHIFILLAKRL